MATIADRKPDALLELGNRADLDTGALSRLDKWYRDSYIELAMNVPFETLEFSVPSQFQEDVDTYAMPAGARWPKCITMNTQLGQSLEPTSGGLTVITLDYKDITYIRQMTAQAPGPPSVYTIFGNQVIVRPVPDNNYATIWDVWQLPIISDPVSKTPLLVPLDWLEIVDMGALMRGFKALLERDKARELQELLYGFKTPTGKVVPGYITFRQTQEQAGSPWENYGITPRKRSYTG